MSATSRDFWAGLVLGAAAGFVAAILTAPEPGEQVRESIRARGIELKHRATELSEEAQRMADEMQRKAAEAVEQEAKRAAQMLEQEKRRVEEAVSGVSSRIPGRGGEAGGEGETPTA